MKLAFKISSFLQIQRGPLKKADSGSEVTEIECNTSQDVFANAALATIESWQQKKFCGERLRRLMLAVHFQQLGAQYIRRKSIFRNDVVSDQRSQGLRD